MAALRFGVARYIADPRCALAPTACGVCRLFLCRLAETYLEQNFQRMSDAEKTANTTAWDLHTMEGEVPEGFRRFIKNST